jgi:hypothetical protein
VHRVRPPKDGDCHLEPCVPLGVESPPGASVLPDVADQGQPGPAAALGHPYGRLGRGQGLPGPGHSRGFLEAQLQGFPRWQLPGRLGQGHGHQIRGARFRGFHSRPSSQLPLRRSERRDQAHPVGPGCGHGGLGTEDVDLGCPAHRQELTGPAALGRQRFDPPVRRRQDGVKAQDPKVGLQGAGGEGLLHLLGPRAGGTGSGPGAGDLTSARAAVIEGVVEVQASLDEGLVELREVLGVEAVDGGDHHGLLEADHGAEEIDSGQEGRFGLGPGAPGRALLGAGGAGLRVMGEGPCDRFARAEGSDRRRCARRLRSGEEDGEEERCREQTPPRRSAPEHRLVAPCHGLSSTAEPRKPRVRRIQAAASSRELAATGTKTRTRRLDTSNPPMETMARGERRSSPTAV